MTQYKDSTKQDMSLHVLTGVVCPHLIHMPLSFYLQLKTSTSVFKDTPYSHSNYKTELAIHVHNKNMYKRSQPVKM
jgi:hypothetical protein